MKVEIAYYFSTRMTITLPSLAKACDRTGVSDRAAAMIASAVLQDMGIISPEDRSKIIDQSKIRRERTKTQKEFQKKGTTVIPGLYFNGRKDKTIKQVVDANEKYY